MLIYPAIDIMEGRCVRLAQGQFDAVTHYGDPVDQARAFADAGAQWIHVVDLDGARAGTPVNHALIGRLARSVPASIQSGGGIRTFEQIRGLLDAGIGRVVVGSTCVEQPEAMGDWLADLGIERLCAALDVRARSDDTAPQANPADPDTYQVAVRGWAEQSRLSLADALTLYPPGSLRHILVTDVARDGVLAGPNAALITALTASRPDLQIQASGGISALADLASVRAAGAAGVIIGRALYEGCFTLAEALEPDHAG